MSDTKLLVYSAVFGTFFSGVCALFGILSWWQARQQQAKTTSVKPLPQSAGWFVAAAILGTCTILCFGYVLYIWLRAMHPYLLLGSVATVCITIAGMWVLVLRVPKSNLIIHRAVYGTGPQTDIDITESLRKAIRDGLVIAVDNNLVDRDPAKGIRKRLELEYSYGNGTMCYVYRPESTQGDIVRLVLPEDSELEKRKAEINHLKGEIIEKEQRCNARIAELTQQLQTKPTTLSAADPRIRLEVESVPTEQAPWRKTQVIFRNEGGSTAYRCRIDDIDLTSAKPGKAIASFQTQETIPANDPATVVATVDTELGLFRNDIVPFLKWELEASPSSEVVKPIVVTYYDYANAQLETAAELVYFPPATQTQAEISAAYAKDISRYRRKNPLEVAASKEIVQSKDQLTIRNQRFRKVG